MFQQPSNLPKSHKKLGLGFFVLAVIIFVSVSYLIWAKVIITIHPDTEQVTQEFIFDVKEGIDVPSLVDESVIPGKIRLYDLEETSTFLATGSKSLDSNVVGEVTIINSYSKEQILVENTRLADPKEPDKVLVRLAKTVTVGPGQQIKVQVYPDDEENFESINPMKLIIPGLWGPLQEKIYAQNEENLSQDGYVITTVTQEDLDRAQEDLKTKLYQQSIDQANGELEPEEVLWPKLVSSKVDEMIFDVQAGDEAAEFSATMKLKTIVVVFDESQLISWAREKLRAALTSDQQLVDLDPKTFVYSVEKYNTETKEANIKVTLTGDSIMADSSGLLDKSQLTGLTEEEVKSYFTQFSEIKRVEVKFQPSWLKKTPRLKEKIEIKVEK